MKGIAKSNKVPDKSIITNEFGNINYCDTYRITKRTYDIVDHITTQIFKVPKWVSKLMKIRNSIVKIFGLKVGKHDEIEETSYYSIGSKAVYFTVTNRNTDEIVMGEDDKHLQFRASVLADREQGYIYLTTIVKFHNIWGKLYFLPVKPFHRLIIQSLLKRYDKRF